MRNPRYLPLTIILTLKYVEHNLYRHLWDTPVCLFTESYLRLPFIQTILFVPATFLPKAAIFLIYRQLFGVGKRFRIAVDIGILITLLVYLTNIPLAAIYNAPRPGHPWTSLLMTFRDNARPFATAGIVQMSIEAVMNFYIFFLPLNILFHLNMPPKRRWQLAGIFSIAIL